MASELKVTSIQDTSGNEIFNTSTNSVSVNTIKNSAGTTALTLDGSGNTTLGGNLVIPNSGTIGSVSDTDAITLDASGNVTFAGNLSAPNFVGMIAAFAMSSAPTGWLACDGSAVSRTTYANLFTAISTTWGSGDSSTTFNLPDLRASFLRGYGNQGTYQRADGGYYYGPTTVGGYQHDAFQSHKHRIYPISTTGNSAPAGPDANGYGNGTRYTSDISDYNEGPARVSDETRPFNQGVNFCIKF